MPIQRSQGILLRRHQLRETSFILSFYTEHFGKIKGIVRGVRGPRAQGHGASAYELFALDDLVFYERKQSEIFTVSHCDLAEFFAPIRASLENIAYATYIVELLDSVTVLSDPHPEVFALTLNCLRLLCDGESGRHTARIFEIKLLSHLGIMPALGMCAHCGRANLSSDSRFSMRHGGLLCKECLTRDTEAYPMLRGTARFIQHIQTIPFDRATRVKVDDKVGRELELILRRFLEYHIERRLNAVKFLGAIERA